MRKRRWSPLVGAASQKGGSKGRAQLVKCTATAKCGAFDLRAAFPSIDEHRQYFIYGKTRSTASVNSTVAAELTPKPWITA